MKPLIKEFEELFNEDFSIDIEGQLRHKGSSKVEGLQQVDIQGAVKLKIDNQLKSPSNVIIYIYLIINSNIKYNSYYDRL